MDKKSSMSRIERQKREKVLRFSIRKYSFGAASVAVAALMFLGARVVSADSVTPVDQPHVEALTQDTSSLASQDKEEPTSSVKVDTAVASQLVTQLKDQLHVKETANTDLLVRAKEELVKAEQTLANSKVSQEEVDALVARLTNVLDQLRAVETPQVKADKNDESTQEVTSEIKPEVAKPTSEISAKSEETSENTNAEQLEKAKASLKLSIDRLEQTIAQTPKNDLTREILEKAIAQVAVAKSAFGGVEVSLRDVEDMNRVIKRNESSVMIARNRLTSGSHDPRNGQSMGQGTGLRSVPIDKTTKRGRLGIVIADSGFVTGYATPSSTIEIRKNGQTLVTSTLDDSGEFKLNAPGIKVGDTVTLVVNGETVATEVVNEANTISFNDSLAYIKQVDGYTAAESDVEITVGGEKYKTKSQSNGYFTVDVNPDLMVEGAEVTAVVTKDGKKVASGTSIVRETKATDFGVTWHENPMIDYSDRDVFSPDTKQYAFVSKGTANQAYDNIRVYREMRIEENGNKYYYWIVDSGPMANAQAGLSKKISVAIPRTVGDPYDFTYTQLQHGRQKSYKEYPTASRWEYDRPQYRAYVKDGEKRSGSSYAENLDAWMDYIEPSNGWRKDIYRKNSGDGTEPNDDAFSRVMSMLGVKNGGLEYNLVRGVIEDKMNVVAGQRTIMTFKTKVLEGDELDQSIMSDWGKKDKSNPMFSEIKSRIANDPYLAFGGYTLGGRPRYYPGQNAIIGTLPLEPREATNYNFQPVSKEQTTKVGVVPDAIKSIENTGKLPGGTTYRWFKDPDVSKVTEPGKLVYGTVEVVIPQRGKFLIDAPVHVIEDKPQTPVAIAKDNGDVTAKPQDSTKVDKITVSYTGEDNNPKTAVGTKDPKGNWTVNTPEVQIDSNTGEITIPENKVKDGTKVTVVTKNGNGADSDPATATAKDVQKPTITSLTPISNAEIDSTNPRKIIVYREEEFSVDVNLTDNSGRLDKVKVDDRVTVTTDTSNPFEMRSQARISDTAKGTDINFTDKSNNLGQNGNATDTNPYKVTISGHVGKGQTVNPDASKNSWTRYITGYDQSNLTNNNNVSNATNNANIQIEFRKQADKYTPTATTPTVNLTSNGTVPDLGSPETYIANKSDLPLKGTTPGTTTTYTWKAGETPTVNNGQVTRTVVVTYPDGSTDEVPVTVKVVDPRTDAEKNNPTPKDQTVNVGQTPDPKKSIGNVGDLPKGTTVEYKTPVDTTTPGDKKTTAVVTYPDGSKDEVPVTVKVVDPRTDAEKNNPTPKDQTVNVGQTPDPKKSIGNVGDLPKGTTVEYKTPVDTTTPGDKKTTAVVTYPDGSKDEVPVTVKVVDPRTDAEKNNPTPKDQTVNVGETPDPKKSIGNVGDLPKGTTVEYKTPVDTTTPGDKKTTAVVTYPDGSKDEVPVTVKVVDPRTDAEKNNPTPKDQTVNVGETPDPKKSIGNVGDLPKGTTVEYKTPVDTTTPGDKKTTAVVTYPDGSKDEVPVTVKVVDPRTDAEKNNPTPKDQTVNVGETPDPKKSIGNVGDLPKGSTVEYKTPVDTATPGDKKTTVVVTYPDGSKDEVPVTVKVVDPRTDADKNNPTPKDQTVNVGDKPDPKKSIGNVDDLPKGSTVEYKTPVDTATPGDKKTTVVVTYPDGSKDEVPVTVKVVDPRTDADKNNPTPKDQTVNVGDKPDPKKSIGNVGDLPKGSTVEYKTPVDTTTPGDKSTTVVVTYPDGSKDEVPVTVKVVNPSAPATDADKNNPTPKDQTVNVGETPDPKGSIGNVGDLPEGTKVEYKTPVDTTTPGDKETTVVVTYPDGSKDEVPVTVKVVDPRTPQTEQPGKIEITPQPNGDAIVTPKKPDGSTYPPGTKVEIPGENGTTIPVTIGDNGSGEVPNDKLPKTDAPGKGTVTEPNKKPSQPVDVTTPARKTPTVDVEQDPKTGDVTVTPKKPDGTTYPPGTKVEIPGKDGPITVTIGEDGKGKVPNSDLPEGKVSGPGKITEPNKPAVEVPKVETPGKVTPATPVTETPVEIEITRKPNGDAIVTPKKPDGKPYPSGSKVVIPGENNTPITVTIGDNGSGEVPNDKLPKKDVPGTGTVTEPNKKPSQPVDVTTPGQKTPTVDVEQDPKTGDVTVTPKKPDGSTFPPGTKVEIPGEDGPITVEIGQDGKGKVPNDKLPKKDVPGTGKITEPGKPAVEVPVTTPGKVTPNTPTTEKPGKIEITRKPNGDAIVTPKKPDGSTYPSGSKVVIPGENNTPIEVTIGDNGSGEVPNDKLPKKDVPGTGKVTEPNKKPSQPVDVTTPARKTPTVELDKDPKTGDVTVTPKKPDGSTFPPGTKVEIPGEDGPITVEIGQDGKGKVPNDKLPKKDVPGTGKITEPGKPAVEVPVTTPGKVTPNTPTTEKPGKIEITRKPNGDAIVTPKKPDGSTYPSGSKVVIPGENNTPIEVTIGDNGSGEVPNDKLPKKDVPGTGKVTEPNKKPSQPVDVTTPARKTPTVELDKDPKTGDVTVTPKKPDGSTFPPGTKVEIPGEDGPITVEIGQDGKGKVPNDKLPKKDVPGTGKITEPGKPAVEVPVTTPGKVTPNTPTTEKPGKIEITRKPNGDAIVTPKKPDGSTYPSGSKVEIPGENGTTIPVTIGDNGSGEVPNDKLPKKDVPGTGTVTEPNKKPSQPVDVTTPARKTPTVDVEQDPKTGDVTVTPKRPDGSTYPPGTKVEIPGKDGKPITVTIGEDGKGKVPNSDLPDGKVPGTGKITEPGQPTVEVPDVTTPGKVTPETPVTEKPVAIEITRKPNGNAIVTPKKPDGSTYPPKTTVEIPGENGTPITVTIGDNGSGEVPNDNLPKKDVPGTGTVTEPNKKPSQPVDVTTPAQKTPTLDVEQDPKTGDVTVTPKKPDGSTYPPGTTVEIPGENGTPITVEIGEGGKGKVPNDKLPKKDVPGTGKITEPGKPTVEVPNVTTPAKVTPETPTTETPSEIEITRKPNGDAIVTPKKPDGKPYPPGTTVEIPSENGTPIKVTIGDNGSGEVPNDNLPKKDVPGTGTVTEPNKKPSQPVNVTTPARKTPTVDVEQDPKTGDVTVTPKRPDGSTYPPGTKVEIPGKDGNPITVTIGEDGKGKVPNSDLPDGKVSGPGKITEPNKPAVEVPKVETPAKVTPETPVTEKPGKIEIDRKPNGDAIVTPKKPDGTTYPSGSKVEIPGENGTTIPVTIGDNGSGEVPNDKLPKKDVPGTGTVTEPNKKPSQPVDVTTPARKTPTVDVEQDPKTGDVTVTPKRPDGSTYPPGTKVEIPGKDGNPITVTIGEDGKGKVPNSELPDGKVPGTGKITEPGKPTVEVPVETPAKVTPETPTTEKPVAIEITRKPNGDAIVTPKKPDGSTYPSGSKVEIPGENGTPITVTIGDNGSGEVPNDKLPKKDVPGTGTVTEPNKKPSQPVDVTTPAQKTPTLDVEQDPKTGEVTVTPKKPDGSTYPPGTKVEIPGKDGNPITVTIGEDGKGKVPNSDLPDGKVPGTAKITEPGQPTVEVPVETPAKVTPATPTTETPSEIEITRKPNGDAVVTPKKPDGSTYPPGTKVEIPGENGTPITVTIGDNGSGEVPNDNLPKKDVPGTGKVTEPNKKPSQPVDVTTPARKTPTVDVEQDPKTGDVTVTPKKPDGSTYPPGTKVEIPGKDGNPITVTIGEDGKGKVPNSELPDGKVPGTGKITEPGKPTVEVPVETPAKVTPETPVTEKPGKIEITQQPNGNAIVTPKKPDGSTYPPGTKVEIPGENGTPITVTIGDNGSGEVPNDNLPKKDVPGTGKVTEPNKKPSQPVDVTTPARKTPTVDVEQDPKTGDVTVTPKKPDGSTYPPGTKVEIPGKDGNPITVTIGEDGKGKVPNSDLPDGKVPGTAKITEPGQPTVEVPVETPAKVTPATPTTETPSEIEITRKPNGDAVVTPKKPDGSTYPPGTKVEIPGENGTPITVTIGDNGSGEVPNDNLPKKDVPGTGKVTEPNKKPSQPVDVTTPARKTPTVDVEQDPKTGDVTVTPKKPDGSTYPPGTKVEIPGKDGNPITVTIGEDGKGKVPNSDLPDGKVPGTAKITEPGQPTVEVPVETPAKVTPATPTTETPSEIEITRKPNGDAVVTPKKPDGSTYPPGTKVEIPGENGTPITVTIGDNGSGEVPNDNLPKKDVPGTGTVTEPNKKPSQPVDVTTPARKTPTVDVEQDPKTGDVTVTPKKPDGSTYPPGTKVEIPGKDGNPITVTIGEDGKGKVPNSDLPDGKVPGTAKITEPGQPTVEVPVETPAKVTPVAVNPNVDHGDTTATNNNGAKSNDSQKVLPNTGTESNATLASLGLLGILGGLGLALGKKKED